jgi:hypothetical protein
MLTGGRQIVYNNRWVPEEPPVIRKKNRTAGYAEKLTRPNGHGAERCASLPSPCF